MDQLIKDKGIKGVKKKDLASAAAAVRSRSAGNVAICIAHRSKEHIVRPDPQLAAVTKKNDDQLLADLHDTVAKLGTIIAEIKRWPAHEVAKQFSKNPATAKMLAPKAWLNDTGARYDMTGLDDTHPDTIENAKTVKSTYNIMTGHGLATTNKVVPMKTEVLCGNKVEPLLMDECPPPFWQLDHVV